MRQSLALAVFALAVALFVYTAFVGTASPATTWVTFGALAVLFGLAAFLAAPHKKERLFSTSLLCMVISVPVLLLIAALGEMLV